MTFREILDELSLTVKTVGTILFIIAFLAIVSSAYNWYYKGSERIISKIEYVKVPEIKVVEKIKRVYVKGPEQILTIEKEKIVEKLKLPNWFAKDADEQAIATADLPETETGYNVVATINTKTGVGNIIAKEKTRSLFGLPNDKQLYGKVGVDTGASKEVTIGAQWKFFRAGNLKLGVFGEGNAKFGNADIGNDFQALGGLLVTYDFTGK